MGQAPSNSAGTASTGSAAQPSHGRSGRSPSGSPSEEPTADPFHLSPISPRLAQPPAPPTLPKPKLDTRPSFASLCKLSKPTLALAIVDPNLPKPSGSTATLGARVARKISKCRKGSAVVLGRPSAAPLAEIKRSISDLEASRKYGSEELAETAVGPSSFNPARRPFVPTASAGTLSSSLDSSTLSGPSVSILTPRTSRPNLITPYPPITPYHQTTRPSHLRHGSGSSSSSSPRSGPPVKAHSPKTRSQAEKEWRARVAAISASTKRRPGGGGGDGAVRRGGGGGDSPAYKGPLPPRPRPAPKAQPDAVIVPLPPTSTAGAIPPHIVLPDKSSPSGQSFTSKRSFETLGHHVNPRPPLSLSPARVHAHPHLRTVSDLSGSPLSHHRPRSRKGSIPLSVSSFYAFSADSRGETRPHSLAADTFLSPVKRAGVAVEVEASSEGEAEHEDEDGVWSHAPGSKGGEMRSGKGDGELAVEPELQFDLALSSSASSTRPAHLTRHRISAPPATPTRSLSPMPPTIHRTPTQPITPRRLSAQHTPPKPHTFGLAAGLSLTPALTSTTIPSPSAQDTPRSLARKERILSLPSISTSPSLQRTPTRTLAARDLGPSLASPGATSTPPLQADTSLHTDTTSPSLPSLLSFALSTPAPTPTRPALAGGATPTTPYSPMTAYILTAPDIDLSFSASGAVPDLDSPTAAGSWGGKNTGTGMGKKAHSHPFASFLDAPSPPRRVGGSMGPAHKSGMGMGEDGPRRVVDGARTAQPLRVLPVPAPGGVPMRMTRRCDLENTSAPAPAPTRKAPPPPSLPPRSAARPLQSKTPNGLPTAREAALGAPERQDRTRGRVRVELCPGMQVGGGVRPPKSGMDKSDLERWLAGTKSG